MKKTKGITLIALIITIIILLILTGVTMNIAVNGGLFNNAQRAVDDTNAKVSNTQDRVDELSGVLDNVASQNDEHNWNRTGDNLTCRHCGLSLMIGDYLDYIPDSTSETVTVTATESGYEVEQRFIQEIGNYWRVLGIEDGDGNGTNETLLIKMESPTETELVLYGAYSYNNGPDIMNKICKTLYSSSRYGEARSINIEDINNCLQYEPTGVIYYDGSTEYETDGFNTQIKELPIWNTIKANGTYTPDGTNTEEKLGSYKVDGYRYDAGSLEITIKAEETIFTCSREGEWGYWIASRGTAVHNSSICFTSGFVTGDEALAAYYYDFKSNGDLSGTSLLLCPVVELKKEIPDKIIIDRILYEFKNLTA